MSIMEYVPRLLKSAKVQTAAAALWASWQVAIQDGTISGTESQVLIGGILALASAVVLAFAWEDGARNAGAPAGETGVDHG